ncbi:hypothetical protein CHLNCDRAFT_140026 [Chlorella variabilis]|uniref:MYND-type domain-containing protein n=1 Tax=Chlorella variabilis TaxID=554065 RepID=E1ZRF0_CHLVA|nr:hypothetical protein CHLNCDRAFT_140026 [Chlorella variabilis]EFN51556.1 hypothetical protein CHLNCDRAFT_140026 [Chlorella variabilis]|eukprot:XP_005843658.1 hypothetical protein CHLNCDRAFT_140026 [Chlorella variabilis]
MFSDQPTSAVWVGGLTAQCRASDVSAVLSSFGAIRALRMGPAPSGGPAAEAGGQQAAEVYFESVGQAAAALTGLNAVVVPRLSGGRALTVQCWQQEAGGGGGGGQPSAAATPLLHAAPAVQKAKGTGAASPPPPRPPPQASRVQQQQQEVRCVNMAEAAAAVQLPGLEQLPAALDFFRSCCFRAVPEQEQGSAVKWAVLQALLARGLRHLSGAAFRQLPVLLTKAGDELLKYRSSDPTVEAEYQSYPAAGRLRSIVRDFASPGLVAVSAEPGSSTLVVQLHLGRLATAGSRTGGGGGGGGSGNGGAPATPPAQAQAEYVRCREAARHLVVSGLGHKGDAAPLCDIARQHGRLQAYLYNARKAALTLHFEEVAAAVGLAREVDGQVVPGLSTSQPLQVEYKRRVEASGPLPAAAPAAQAAPGKGQQAKAAQAPAPVENGYSATEPSAALRVKRLGAQATRPLLAAFGARFGARFKGCGLYTSTRLGYLFFSETAAAQEAAAALRGGSGLPPGLKGEEPLLVEYRQEALAGNGGATAGSRPCSAQGLAEAEEGPCCARCGGGPGAAAALRFCSGCRAVRYCGRDCQLADWDAGHCAECGQLRALAAALQAPAASDGRHQQQQQPGGLGMAGLQLLAAALRAPSGRESQMVSAMLAAAAPAEAQEPSEAASAEEAAEGSGSGSADASAAPASPDTGTATSGGTAGAEGGAAAAAGGAERVRAGGCSPGSPAGEPAGSGSRGEPAAGQPAEEPAAAGGKGMTAAAGAEEAPAAAEAGEEAPATVAAAAEEEEVEVLTAAEAGAEPGAAGDGAPATGSLVYNEPAASPAAAVAEPSRQADGGPPAGSRDGGGRQEGVDVERGSGTGGSGTAEGLPVPQAGEGQ